MYFRLVAACLIGFALTTSSFASPWTNYKNDRFGYQLVIPQNMTVVDRAQDGSGVTWQTGSFKIEVYGINNPYHLASSSWFSNVRKAAGDRIVDEKLAKANENPAWQELLYLKKGRRTHRKTFVGSHAIVTVEISYPYSLRNDKQPIGEKIADSLIPGDLTTSH